MLVQLDVTIVNVALAAMETRPACGDFRPAVGGRRLCHRLRVAAPVGRRASATASARAGCWPSGFAIFITASAGCGFAPNATTLIAARVAQGAGAALMVPSSLALLNHACGNDQTLRGHAVAWWTAAGSVGLAAGPIAGGLLIHWFGWRSIFFVNVPLGLLAIWLTLRFVEETRIDTARRGFDLTGQLLGIVTLAALTGAVIEAGERGIAAPLVLGCFALAVAAGAGFILAESRGAHPMLPLTPVSATSGFPRPS